MKAKGIVVLVVVVLAALAVWKCSPGLRTRAKSAVGKVGEWSEEARQADPVGFIDYAEGRLEKHLSSLKGGRVNIKNGVARTETEITKSQELFDRACELAVMFRDTFQKAEEDAAFPVTVAGFSYSRQELIEQVRLVLLQRTNYTQAMEGLAAARKAAQGADVKLLRQVTDTQAALAALPAKREIVRANQLAGNVQELLSQIDALIDRNETVLEDAPVRTVEELLAGAAAPVAEPDVDVDVMAFLGGAE